MKERRQAGHPGIAIPPTRASGDFLVLQRNSEAWERRKRQAAFGAFTSKRRCAQ